MITLLHTSAVHIATFDRLSIALGFNEPLRHIVREHLLADARAYGLSTRVVGDIRIAVAEAARNSSVVLCTCSTIGGCAELAADCADGLAVLRVDRPMACRAVSLGTRVVVVAALASTFDSTCKLLLDEAARCHKEISIVKLLCEGAWTQFEACDIPGYIAALVPFLKRAILLGDVVVLSQASMAPAADEVTMTDVPILSSPRLGLEAAIAVVRSLDQKHAVQLRPY